MAASGLGDNRRHNSWLAETGRWAAKGLREAGTWATVLGFVGRRCGERKSVMGKKKHRVEACIWALGEEIVKLVFLLMSGNCG